MPTIVSIDIGGSSTALALLDENLNILHRSGKILTAEMASGHELVEALGRAKDEAVKASGTSDSDIIGVGVGSPGPLNAGTGVILNTPHILYLQNYPLRQKLTEAFGCLVALDNDANLFALGEATKGAGSDKAYVVGITLGTGFGFGIVMNGRVYRGATGSAAEYGLSPWLGTSETWEQTVSIGGIMRAYKELGGTAETPKEVFDLAESGDEWAIKVWQNYGRVLGMAVTHVVNMIDPNMVVFGGEMRGAWGQFAPSMIDTIHEHIFELPASQLVLCPSTLGVEATLYGAAQFALNSVN